MYDWNPRLLWLYSDALLEGALVTVLLALLTVVLGTVIGSALAFLRRSKIEIVSLGAGAFIALFRALPILVVLIWIYYVVPSVLGWAMSPFTAALIALSAHLAAFVAETVRSGIESIPRSQFESGLALGLTPFQTMRRIVIPQAVRTMLPNLLGLYITEAKNCSLASVIAVNELLHRANTVISDTFRPLELYTAVAVIYLLILLPLIGLARWTEKKYSAGIQPILPAAA